MVGKFYVQFWREQLLVENLENGERSSAEEAKREQENLPEKKGSQTGGHKVTKFGGDQVSFYTVTDHILTKGEGEFSLTHLNNGKNPRWELNRIEQFL